MFDVLTVERHFFWFFQDPTAITMAMDVRLLGCVEIIKETSFNDGSLFP